VAMALTSGVRYRGFESRRLDQFCGGVSEPITLNRMIPRVVQESGWSLSAKCQDPGFVDVIRRMLNFVP